MIAFEVAHIVEDVLLGRICDRPQLAARVSALPEPLDGPQSEALHLAGHFLDDEDIRHSDASYDRTQRDELLEEIRRLKRVAHSAA